MSAELKRLEERESELFLTLPLGEIHDNPELKKIAFDIRVKSRVLNWRFQQHLDIIYVVQDKTKEVQP